MPAHPKPRDASVIPALRYRDAPRAIDFLCKAFGFRKHLVVTGARKNTIAHAQLTYGNGMIMLGSIQENEYGKMMAQPDEAAGRNTQSPYVIVKDIEAHYARAKKAGARIAIELVAQEYGGKLYSCYDPEGHLWNFGSYDPWAES